MQNCIACINRFLINHQKNPLEVKSYSDPDLEDHVQHNKFEENKYDDINIREDQLDACLENTADDYVPYQPPMEVPLLPEEQQHKIGG